MLRVSAIGLVLLSASAAATEPRGVFSGEVRVDGSEPHAFDVYFAVGATEVVKLDGGYNLELSVPSFNKSLARLSDSTGKVLHESSSIGQIQKRPSFIYQLCDSRVLFVSPARTDLAACSG